MSDLDHFRDVRCFKAVRLKHGRFDEDQYMQATLDWRRDVHGLETSPRRLEILR